MPSTESAAPADLTKTPAFVEMQYELVDLRREVEALRAASKSSDEKPALDPEAIKSAVASAPAFVEMQYEAVDLRNQVDTLQKELSRLRGIFGSLAGGS